MSALSDRKSAHLDLCVAEDVEARRGTLLDEVHLIHEALPELAVEDVDPSVELFGRHLAAPIVICGMTGGTPRAGEINRELARVAQRHRLALGLGSQRAMLLDPSVTHTYRVRDVAPDALLLANIGAVQAREAGVRKVRELADAVGADAVCVHLNAAQELVQDEGDRDFRGCTDAIARLARELPLPVVVKETGCGFSPATLGRLRSAGVTWVDVSGAGGTTWTGVEGLRGSPRQRALGETLREWGVPTAAAVLFAVRAGLRTIASGGLRSALDCARALALGAELTGMALPFLRACAAGGERLDETARHLIEGLRAVMLLTGARTVSGLRVVPRILGPNLRSWAVLGAVEGPGDDAGERKVVWHGNAKRRARRLVR